MSKAELIAKLAEDAGITKTQANATLDSFISAVTKTLKGGGKVIDGLIKRRKTEADLFILP